MNDARENRTDGAEARIRCVADLPTYAPPGHSGTTNVRLVEPEFNGRFELVLGTIAPGGSAARHAHADEAQVIYVLQGRAWVALGQAPAEICGPQSVISIPAGVEHELASLGPEPLRLLIVYSPPLPR